MCEFCGSAEETKMARMGAYHLAEQLERVADHYRALADGRIKPHTDKMKEISATAKMVIRRLVDDFV